MNKAFITALWLALACGAALAQDPRRRAGDGWHSESEHF